MIVISNIYCNYKNIYIHVVESLSVEKIATYFNTREKWIYLIILYMYGYSECESFPICTFIYGVMGTASGACAACMCVETDECMWMNIGVGGYFGALIGTWIDNHENIFKKKWYIN